MPGPRHGVEVTLAHSAGNQPKSAYCRCPQVLPALRAGLRSLLRLGGTGRRLADPRSPAAQQREQGGGGGGRLGLAGRPQQRGLRGTARAAAGRAGVDAAARADASEAERADRVALVRGRPVLVGSWECRQGGCGSTFEGSFALRPAGLGGSECAGQKREQYRNQSCVRCTNCVPCTCR